MTWDEFKARGIPGRLEAAHLGQNPTVVTKLESGFVVLADSQFLPGYCILLADPLVPSLNDLDIASQTVFLRDMSTVGHAISNVTRCERVNYAIFGNIDPYLHAHIVPRYAWEPPEIRRDWVNLYPKPEFFAAEKMFDPVKHAELRAWLETSILGISGSG